MKREFILTCGNFHQLQVDRFKQILHLILDYVQQKCKFITIINILWIIITSKPQLEIK